MGGNRPDCAYFLLLGLCGAAFLLTIGGILTYIAFNPGSIDSHPHSALSHIPHFHHHSSGKPHHETPQHHHYYPHGQEVPSSSNHNNNNHNAKQQEESHNTHHASASANSHHPVNKNESHHSPQQHEKDKQQQQHVIQASDSSKKNNKTFASNDQQHHSATTNNQHNANVAAAAEAAYEAKAKQSLALAIIGPLCLLMGIIVTLIVGILALKYDCDHEPEPNIAFLRLRSEMSLNFDADKNNYELLRPSSSIDQSGGQYSINPTGMPRC